MNPTSPYWTVPPTTIKTLKPIINNPGFLFVLPWPDVSTAGFYHGQRPVPGRKELIFRDDPEYFAVDGIVPATAGIPRINPYDPVYKFSREKFTVRY